MKISASGIRSAFLSTILSIAFAVSAAVALLSAVLLLLVKPKTDNFEKA